MQKLTYQEQNDKVYADVLAKLQETRPEIVGVDVDVSVTDGEIKLTVGENSLYMLPEQAADLYFNLRRAIVKVKPKVLRKKR